MAFLNLGLRRRARGFMLASLVLGCVRCGPIVVLDVGSSGTVASSSTGAATASSGTGGAGGLGGQGGAGAFGGQGGAGAFGGQGGAGAFGGQGGMGGAMVCVPGVVKACYSGPAATLGVGSCVAGKQTCAADGATFGPCLGEVTPVPEDCATPVDDNCDGTVNEGCGPPTSCAAILAATPGAGSGVYAIDPDGDGPNPPFQVYCDMVGDGGGWTLVAKVHRYDDGPIYDEPVGWFALERDTATLADVTSYDNRQPGQASWGQARLAALAASAKVARFHVMAEDDLSQTGTWYKLIDPGVWSWFSTTDHAATLVCTDLAMTKDCAPGKVLSTTDGTWMDNMNLVQYGYPASCPIHMRLNNDNQASFTAVCSCTFNANGNQWHDHAIDGHWGNGLEIWMR